MYTDPGILSMIIAAVVGAIVAIPAYFVLWKNKLKAWFIKDQEPKDKSWPASKCPALIEQEPCLIKNLSCEACYTKYISDRQEPRRIVGGQFEENLIAALESDRQDAGDPETLPGAILGDPQDESNKPAWLIEIQQELEAKRKEGNS